MGLLRSAPDANSPRQSMCQALRPELIAYSGLEVAAAARLSKCWSKMADDSCRQPKTQASVSSAMLSASSNSAPRYLTVLSTLVRPSRT